MKVINMERLYEQAKRHASNDLQAGILWNWALNRPAHLYLLVQNNELKQALEAYEDMIRDEVTRLVQAGVDQASAWEIVNHEMLTSPHWYENDRAMQKQLEVEQKVKVRPLGWIADNWSDMFPSSEFLRTEIISSPTPTETTSPKPARAKKSKRPSKPSEP